MFKMKFITKLGVLWYCLVYLTTESILPGLVGKCEDTKFDFILETSPKNRTFFSLTTENRTHFSFLVDPKLFHFSENSEA